MIICCYMSLLSILSILSKNDIKKIALCTAFGFGIKLIPKMCMNLASITKRTDNTKPEFKIYKDAMNLGFFYGSSVLILKSLNNVFPDMTNINSFLSGAIPQLIFDQTYTDTSLLLFLLSSNSLDKINNNYKYPMYFSVQLALSYLFVFDILRLDKNYMLFLKKICNIEPQEVHDHYNVQTNCNVIHKNHENCMIGTLKHVPTNLMTIFKIYMVLYGTSSFMTGKYRDAFTSTLRTTLYLTVYTTIARFGLCSKDKITKKKPWNMILCIMFWVISSLGIFVEGNGRVQKYNIFLLTKVLMSFIRIFLNIYGNDRIPYDKYISASLLGMTFVNWFKFANDKNAKQNFISKLLI